MEDKKKKRKFIISLSFIGVFVLLGVGTLIFQAVSPRFSPRTRPRMSSSSTVLSSSSLERSSPTETNEALKELTNQTVENFIRVLLNYQSYNDNAPAYRALMTPTVYSNWQARLYPLNVDTSQYSNQKVIQLESTVDVNAMTASVTVTYTTDFRETASNNPSTQTLSTTQTFNLRFELSKGQYYVSSIE